MLKAKIHGARVTRANLEYTGSITLSRELLDATGILVNEKVLVANLTNGERFETYVIEGERGAVEVIGAAAHLAGEGHRLIVLAFCLLDQKEVESHEPVIVRVDEQNKPL